ncbi:hypothetical protein IKR20_02725 [bacterium]|nr:hypothetical protein [bacterium]
MKKVTYLIFIAIFACLALVACGGGDKGGETVPDGDTATDTGDTVTDGDPADTGDTVTDGDTDEIEIDGDTGTDTDDIEETDVDIEGTIVDIQTGLVPSDTEVTFECVVTAIAYNQDDSTHENQSIKGLYVSELIDKAAPYTGIYVFIKKTAGVNEFKVGDKLEITGVYSERYEVSQIAVEDNGNILYLGTADVPEPAEIADSSTIATPYELVDEEYSPTANHGADTEKYESVLVRVKDVEITNSDLGHGAFEVTGNLAINKELFYYPGSRSEGVKFDSISGVLIYSFNAFQLAPRSIDDFKVKIEDATIRAVQKAEVVKGSTVKISESVVTAIAYNQDSTTHENTAIKGLYVSEIIPQAEPYTGIYVFIKGTADVDAFAVGDKLEITGTVDEYYDSTQISLVGTDNIKKLGTADLPAPAEIDDPSKISTPYAKNGDEWEPTGNHGADAEKYESVLVKVKNVTVTNNNLGHGAFEVTGNLAINKDLYYYPGDRSIGVEFDSISGILIYSYSAFQLAPRSGDDIVAAAVE